MAEKKSKPTVIKTKPTSARVNKLDDIDLIVLKGMINTAE